MWRKLGHGTCGQLINKGEHPGKGKADEAVTKQEQQKHRESTEVSTRESRGPMGSNTEERTERTWREQAG